MTLKQFIEVAKAANLVVVYHEAHPYGGWSSRSKTASSLIATIADELGEDATEETIQECLSDALQVVVVVAKDEKGAIMGAWSEVTWRLGQRYANLDAAYEAVYS